MSVNATERLGAWVGRKESRFDVVTAWPAAALAATLDRRDPDPKPGDTIPPGWHWLYFLEAAPASDLGPDGHPKWTANSAGNYTMAGTAYF
jgi:3-methylfumaryl-CoA hydratase